MKITEAKAGMKVAVFGMTAIDTMFTGAVDGDSGTVLAGMGEPIPSHPDLRDDIVGNPSGDVLVLLDKNGEIAILDEDQSVVLLEGGK